MTPTTTATDGMALPEVKTCISCKQQKPKTSEHFYYRNKKKGYLSSWCKPCRSARRAATSARELELQRKRRSKVYRECGCGEALRPRQRACSECLTTRRREAKRRDKCLYRGRLRKATPKWADRDAIRRIYTNCPHGMVVDHIIPIRGEHISGLHVAENLQYLTPFENMSKGNKYGELREN